MVRSKLIAVAGIVALAFAIAAPAHAFFFDPGQPLVRSDTFAGNAAISYHLSVPAGGSAVTVGIEGFGTGIGNAGFGVWSDQFAFAGTSYNGKNYTHVEGPVVGTLIDERSGGTDGGPFGVALGTTLAEGEYSFTVVGTSDATSMTGDADVWATNGATVTAVNVGTGFLYREPDFTGGVNVSTLQQGVGAKAIAGSSVSQTVTGKLYGIFQAVIFDPIAAISYDDPAAGHHVASPPGGLFFFLGDAPGTYRFNIDANVGASSLAGIFAWGGDVTPA